MAKRKPTPIPRLKEDAEGTLRCPVCGMPFFPKTEDVDKAFWLHFQNHEPGQKSEDVNQAAARIVRETTD